MKVTFERCTRLGLSITGIDASFLVVAVARIPSSTVFGPRPHAHPAEFILALLARHMAINKTNSEREQQEEVGK